MKTNKKAKSRFSETYKDIVEESVVMNTACNHPAFTEPRWISNHYSADKFVR